MVYDMAASGERIRQLRKTKGMTQEQLAGKLHIGERHLRRIEAGEKGPSVDILVEISTLFSVSLDYIIIGKRPKDEIKQRLHIALKDLSSLIDEL